LRGRSTEVEDTFHKSPDEGLDFIASSEASPALCRLLEAVCRFLRLDKPDRRKENACSLLAVWNSMEAAMRLFPDKSRCEFKVRAGAGRLMLALVGWARPLPSSMAIVREP
jgi:hypothetical protein